MFAILLIIILIKTERSATHTPGQIKVPGVLAVILPIINKRAVCGTISISVPTSTFVSISKLLSPNGGSYAEKYLDNVYVHTHTYVLTYMHCVYYTSVSASILLPNSLFKRGVVCGTMPMS